MQTDMASTEDFQIHPSEDDDLMREFVDDDNNDKQSISVTI